jgi:hypothetical protein
MKNLVSCTVVTVCILSVITIPGCHSVNPKLNDEYMRTGLSQDNPQTETANE